MADEIDLGETPENGFMDEPLPQVAILTQYVKDLSFENPNAPNSLQAQTQPKIDVNVGVNAKRAAENVYEVELKISAKAEVDGDVSFMVELVYAGLFGLQNVPEEALEPFCIIEAPRLLFPFARRIVADTVRDGGFPPLMLDPIDFGALYMAQQQGGQVGNA
ncbi:protein-export chaperone SecB [Sandarakinorhabdus sp.]|uniref:protein-export chaperone SecB n=1 Tax=Sandarakinorhabdus sp. TaxID=1916663 RepID=UPI00286E1D20|nr:protein-export chaperone SecB [Sandarakinorhabdus sp.]